jgi:DnaJ-class molecular chaperone
MAKDYYFVLGVSREESGRGIRKAFRDLARRHHPDYAGPSGTPMFRDALEAYRVLSDPERRREYDAELGASIPVRISTADSRRERRNRAAFAPLELFADRASIRPASEHLFDHILRNFLSPGHPKSERPEPLLCDIALSPEEARRGGVLLLRIPIREPCPDCHGAGHVFGFGCRRCDATGDARSEITIPLDVPPGVRSGAIVEFPLDGWGIRNLWLRARIRVGI